MKFKEGQILNFAYADSLFAKLIRFRNKFYFGTPYVHTAIITEVSKDYIEIAEALDKGFTISNYETWWLENKVKEGIIEVGETVKKLNNVKFYAKKYEGSPYGFLSIFYLGLSLFSNKIIKYSDGVKSLICSEAVTRILYDASNKKIDFEKEFDKTYDQITPDDLANSKEIKWY